MGRIHSDAQFAGSSSVTAHVEMRNSWELVATRWKVVQQLTLLM